MNISKQLLNPQYPLHLLGWKAFQDLAIALSEECLQRPVQTFLPGNDAGRDGAFVGAWESDSASSGETTIQCKFTSQPNQNLTPSLISNELEKAKKLVTLGLAHDYIILTNHSITGQSELKIKGMFQAAGVGRCRVFGYDWIIKQILSSPKLRMMAPRLYGMGDLSDLMDERAYEQAQLILSSMGDDLQRLVVTDAHRNSVRAVSQHNLVVLLGAPAAGKSTIGASLAIGAADIWKCMTIRATSPADVQKHLKPGEKQFFWIDDAWGSTQYQKERTEEWNHVLPLIRSGINQGSRFLFTSRDYIWNAAVKDLKIQALPLLSKSQVIIDVHEISTQERAQILYNHIKFGDQPREFKAKIKPFLPSAIETDSFLPEVARRLGSTFFVSSPITSREQIIDYFNRPAEFLLDTINSLSATCRAAIGVVFLNGGSVAAPVTTELLENAARAFGVNFGEVRNELQSLNGSMLLLLQTDEGPVWTYKHPTISDAFAKYLASSVELIEMYLTGAKPESIVREVVCSGCDIPGAPVIVPDTMHELLINRLQTLEAYRLIGFLSYRSNKKFAESLIASRPDILTRLSSFHPPVKDDLDTELVIALSRHGLLPEEKRLKFYECAREALVNDADASIFQDERIKELPTTSELENIIALVQSKVIPNISSYTDRIQEEWQADSDPDQHFDDFEASVRVLAAVAGNVQVVSEIVSDISERIGTMQQDYNPPSSTSAPTSNSSSSIAPISELFRDVDEVDS